MIQIFKEFISKHSLENSKLLISVSGGVDSMVLLFMAVNCLDSKNLFVININHNTRDQNLEEAVLVKEFCDQNNLQFFTESITLPGSNFEENARLKRHSIYKEYISRFNLDGVLLGHHRDDVVETFLYNLFKGSFLEGLSSLKGKNESLKIFRPLIEVSKLEVYDFAKDKQIPYLEDESNLDTKYARNFLRQEVIPLIKTRFFNFSKQLAQKSQLFEELNEYLSSNLQHFVSDKIAKKAYGKILLKSDFLSLPSFMQYNLLKEMGLNLKSFNHFLELKKSFESSGFQLNFKKFNVYVASDHFLFSDFTLDELAIFYFDALKTDSFEPLMKFASGLKYNGKSFMKSKVVKLLPFYFRSGIPLLVEDEKIVKFIVKNI